MKLYRSFSYFLMGCSCGKETIHINGKTYTIKSRLGEGGFSVVDLVQDQKTHRTYALKRMICHSKEDERTAMREAEYHNMFLSPYILECIDVALVESYDGLHPHRSEVLLLLPYYRKGTLQDELTMRSKTKSHISEERVLRLFRQMCEGVKTMHNAQPHPLAHRDIKPANVLMDSDDTPVWMDFGSMGKARQEIRKASEARALQSICELSAKPMTFNSVDNWECTVFKIVKELKMLVPHLLHHHVLQQGTYSSFYALLRAFFLLDLASEKCSMAYRAPELFNVESHSSIDERVDIWSLGCTLYAMCYFISPFELAHQRGDSVALAVISGIVEFPEDTPYSDGMHNLIKTMLEVSALQRPFIDGVLFQVDSLLPIVQDRV